MEVALIRHTSVDVPSGMCYGQTDVPLKPTSEQETAITQENLKNYLPSDHIYASPLTRCVRLASYCGYPGTEQGKWVMEINLGSQEMKPSDLNNDPCLQEWYDDYLSVVATGEESSATQYQHVSHFLDELKAKPCQWAAIFAHGGALVCVQVHTGIIEPKEAFDALTPYDGIIGTTL